MKKKTISRKTQYLPKEEWRIGIPHPNLHNMVMRIKYIINLKDPENLDMLIAITKYYISPKLYNLQSNLKYLKQNSIIKTQHKSKHNWTFHMEPIWKKYTMEKNMPEYFSFLTAYQRLIIFFTYCYILQLEQMNMSINTWIKDTLRHLFVITAKNLKI